MIPEYGRCWLGQAKPSVFTRLGALRRLFTSRQGRTGVGAGLTPDEGVQERRQAGQSRGVRGLGRLMMGPIQVPKARQAEDEEEHEQEQEHLKGHNNPRCLK
jgi:hypothetical protein